MSAGDSFKTISPDVGTLCAAKSVDDAAYYRGQVHAVVNGLAKIFFVDFGNFNDIPLKDIKELPASITLDAIPAQCIKCKLADAVASKKTTDVKKAFDNFGTLTVTPVSVEQDAFIVQIP